MVMIRAHLATFQGRNRFLTPFVAFARFFIISKLWIFEIFCGGEKLIIHSFIVQKPVISLRFGPYGREENSLIIVHGRGSLTIKIWRRTADIDAAINVIGAPAEQDIPLPVPKKTKLYVEQTEREREFAPEMHRTFQRDLSRLRLETARAYVKTLTDVNIVSFFYLYWLLLLLVKIL